MLSYIQIHLFFLFPPTLALLALYYPLFGRRDGLKILWLTSLATIWTTPWDNFILSQIGWDYPEDSILGKIFLVPIEEHMFFIIQPIFLILLHSLIIHPKLLPFDPSVGPRFTRTTVTQSFHVESKRDEKMNELVESDPTTTETKRVVQTLPRRPGPASLWLGVMFFGGLLVNEAHELVPGLELFRVGRRAFYLGWILLWISPVIAFLTVIGARMGRRDWVAWAIGSAWLCMVDTIAIRNGAWRISPATSLEWEVWRNLPIEEFTFFLLSSYLVVLSSSLISHLHVLPLLSTRLPPCPPGNFFNHVGWLANTILQPPDIDVAILNGLLEAEETLRKGSKSFEVAKLAFGREMRIGLVAIYAWCRVTDDLIDDASPPEETQDTLLQTKLHNLSTIRSHLTAAYEPYPAQANLDKILDTLPHLTAEVRSAFALFSGLIPRLVPIDPFLELCSGYETDMNFETVDTAQLDRANNFTHLPVKTTDDLLHYADDVAGSVASAICYLAWSVLTDAPESHEARPVDSYSWSRAVHSGKAISADDETSHVRQRIHIVEKAREMGRCLQLVNIARDVAKDAIIGRVYVPLSWFKVSSDLLDVLDPVPQPPSYRLYTFPLLDIADTLRRSSAAAMDELPRIARGGTKAMVASYYEIAEEIRRRHGEVEAKGVKVKKSRRLLAAAKAMWGLTI